MEQRIHTEHFTFDLLVKDNYFRGTHFSQYLELGKKEKPCLSLTIPTAESIEIRRYENYNIAGLSNIESLYECVIGMSYNNFKKHSFGKELLNWTIEYIRTKFPHIEFLELTDESAIPCNREINDKLDLLSYSIALYGKTWYELKFNAIIQNKEKYDIYRREVESYISAKMVDWDTFSLNKMNNQYVREALIANEEIYKTMYESSKTYPEFFNKVSKYVGDNKCKFFKGWLQNFIEAYVNISKRWAIPIRSIGGARKSRKRK